MANSQELFEQMKDLFTQFETEHEGSTKAAKSRARKSIGELKKLVCFKNYLVKSLGNLTVNTVPFPGCEVNPIVP